jgi:hypothetical protein
VDAAIKEVNEGGTRASRATNRAPGVFGKRAFGRYEYERSATRSIGAPRSAPSSWRSSPFSESPGMITGRSPHGARSGHRTDLLAASGRLEPPSRFML